MPRAASSTRGQQTSPASNCTIQANCFSFSGHYMMVLVGCFTIAAATWPPALPGFMQQTACAL